MNLSDMDINSVLQYADCCVSESSNFFLSVPFSHDEVRKAAFDINPSKSPGLDEFTALFFQMS